MIWWGEPISFKKFHSDLNQLLTTHFWINVWIHKFCFTFEWFFDYHSWTNVNALEMEILMMECTLKMQLFFFVLVWLWDLVPTQTQNEPQSKQKLYLFVNEHLCWHDWNSYIQKTKNKSCTKKKKSTKNEWTLYNKIEAKINTNVFLKNFQMKDVWSINYWQLEAKNAS